jgi:PBSX family phage terminase large subunit
MSTKARAFVTAQPRRINIQHGAVRTGKTTNALIVFPKRVIRQIPKGGEIIITGRTVESAYRNVVRPMQQMYGSRVSYNRGEHTGNIAGRDFFVFGANDEKAAEKIQGMTVGYWHGDEASLYPENFIKMGLNRMSLDGACCDLTMNPASPYHHLKTGIIDRAGELDASVFHYVLEDNRHNLAPNYIENLIAEYDGLDTLWARRYILGEWVAAEGAIYDFWDERQHVVGEAPAAEYWGLAADYGTSNATAVGLFGVNRKARPKVWLEAEYYYSGLDTGRTKTDAEFANDIIAWLEAQGMCKGERRKDAEGFEFLYAGSLRPRYIYVDPAAASFKAELRRRGFPVRDADNDLVNGIRTQATLLKSGAYAVHRRCARTIRDYPGYVWDAKAQRRGEDKPLKGSGASPDQTKDMERYFLRSEFPENNPLSHEAIGRLMGW